MKSLQTILTEKMSAAFAAAGYDASYGLVRLSDRPDLCEFQCNGAMAGAKKYHKAPFMIAEDAVKKAEELFGKDVMEITVVRPGFININVTPSFLSPMIEEIGKDAHLSIPQAETPKKILIDYGGPNVAKPLHVGHLRSAVIGESLKRILRAAGHEVLGDVHLGDWGLQM
ncbi:MAG: arginine--tRNA ligase, partial [Lachnospiraceae bacterium]|nr:arginine--tRNA ligase [Lachnospiraceae bacterium]